MHMKDNDNQISRYTYTDTYIFSTQKEIQCTNMSDFLCNVYKMVRQQTCLE